MQVYKHFTNVYVRPLPEHLARTCVHDREGGGLAGAQGLLSISAPKLQCEYVELYVTSIATRSTYTLLPMRVTKLYRIICQ